MIDRPSFYDPYCGRGECKYRHPKEPLVIRMKDGNDFRIDTVSVLFHKTLLKQLTEEYSVQMKFILRDDEEFPGTEKVEQWDMVFFPMYKNGFEMAHAAIDSDSPVNGNLVVEDGHVVSSSSNYCAHGYGEVQDHVVNFAASYVEKLLEKYL